MECQIVLLFNSRFLNTKKTSSISLSLIPPYTRERYFVLCSPSLPNHLKQLSTPCFHAQNANEFSFEILDFQTTTGSSQFSAGPNILSQAWRTSCSTSPGKAPFSASKATSSWPKYAKISTLMLTGRAARDRMSF